MPQCPRCGESYSESATLASCPVCLFRLGLGDTGDADTVTGADSTAARPPHGRIGAYAIIEVLGVGGMGVVYLAEQDEPIHRRVAVKVIKAGLCTPEVLARFEAEREALALMSHPAIAAVLDAGATDDGRPYVVMEYVPGLPITDYCDRRRLGLRQRLELFREVCGAVQHAHHKGVVHRDLKPSNVLITEVDGLPRVKVIDFGLAKALHGRLTDASLFTRFGVVLGTPSYMSPEQIAPSSLDIDTRTDVYSLGVLLYELLTGVLPFTHSGVREAAIAELRHLLLELEPERPSQRFHALGDQAEEVAQQRSADVPTLRRLLRDDLDWIVMHALERDRARRYQSAGELAADINRHLSDEPVSAGPPSAGYRIRKLARRHRTAAAGIVATAVALIAGAIVSGALFLRAEQARRAADGHRRVAERRGYVAEIAAADASLRIGSVAEARRHLDLCPEAARGWEWRHLAMRTDASFVSSHVEGGRIEAVAETASGEIACVVVPPVYDEQHCASLWLFDPARDTWRPAALDESVLTVSPDGARAVTTPWWFGGELGSNAAPSSPVPASERGLLRLVDTDSLAPRATFHLRDAGRWAQPADLAGPEPYYLLVDPVLLMNDFDGDPIRTLEGRYPETVSAVISPDGTRMAAWSWNNTIQLWDLANGRDVGRLVGHGDGIIGVAIASGGERLASSSWDRTLRLWDLASAGATATIATDPVVTSVVFSPDGRRLAWGDSDGRVFVAEAANPAAAESSAAHRGAVRSLVFSPDGTLLASGGMEGAVRLWRTEPLQPLGELRGHLGPVTALAFTDEGRVVAAGSEIGELRLFSVRRTPMRSFGAGPSGDLNLLAVGTDRSIALTARRLVERSDAAVRVWDPDSGKETWHIPLRLPSSVAPSSAAYGFFPTGGAINSAMMASAQLGEPTPGFSAAMYGELSADGTWLALTIGNEVQLWRLSDAELAGTAPYSLPRTAVAFRPDGGAILTAGPDGVVQVFSMEDGHWILNRNLDWFVLGADWSPDGKRAALLLPFDRRVVVVDVEHDSVLLEISYTDGPAPTNLDLSEQPRPAFSADGLRLAAPVSGGAVAVWDASTGARLTTLQGHGGTPTSAAFSPDGTRLLTGAADGRVRVWDALSGELLLQLEDAGFDRIAPSAVRFSAGIGGLDPSSRLKPGAVLKTTPRTFGPVAGKDVAVVAVGFSRDGRSIGATLINGEVRIWNAQEVPMIGGPATVRGGGDS